MIFDGAYAWGWQSMLLDYLVAFTPLGLAGLFRGKAWGIFPGTALGCAVRFLVHFISGITIYRIYEPKNIPGFGTFDNANLYSLVYNGSYMLPNMLLALAIAAVHRTPHQMRIYIILLFYYTPNSGKIQGLFTKNTVFVNYVHFLCKSRYVNF